MSGQPTVPLPDGQPRPSGSASAPDQHASGDVAAQRAAFDRDVYGNCRDCRVWDPEHQPSVQRELERNPDAYADRVFFTVKNGMTLSVPGLGNVELHTDMLLCPKHAVRCVELYGPVQH